MVDRQDVLDFRLHGAQGGPDLDLSGKVARDAQQRVQRPGILPRGLALLSAHQALLAAGLSLRQPRDAGKHAPGRLAAAWLREPATGMRSCVFTAERPARIVALRLGGEVRN